MARVKGAMMTRKHRKKILGLAKGYWGNKSRHYKMANQQMMKSGRYAYVGRKQKKRDFRQLWITRISAGCKANGMNYSTFMHGLKLAGIHPTGWRGFCMFFSRPAVPRPESGRSPCGRHRWTA